MIIQILNTKLLEAKTFLRIYYAQLMHQLYFTLLYSNCFYIGIIKRAIMESGTVLSTWSLAKRSQKIAYQIGTKFGIGKISTAGLVSELQKVEATKLFAAAEDIVRIN